MKRVIYGFFAVISFLLLLSSPVLAAVPGQIVSNPDHPQWLYRDRTGDGTQLTPVFLVGPGDPEGFLYRGTRNADGTRTGDQMQIVNDLKGTGANTIYMQIIRSHGGDGDSSQNPFIGSDPSNGLDQDILNQWEQWFTEMDSNDIVVYLFFYDDAINVSNNLGWSLDGSGNLNSQEKAFIDGIINRFKHHKNLVWVIMEEVQEMGSDYVPHAKKIAEEIKRADENNHPVGVHQLGGLSLVSGFVDDPNIDIFSVQYGNETSSISSLHNAAISVWNSANGKYNATFGEFHGTKTPLKNADRTLLRKMNWSAVTGGANLLWIGAYDASYGNPTAEMMQDAGRVRDFMESLPVDTMAPHDELSSGNYVLANPTSEYVIYAQNGGSLTVNLSSLATNSVAFWYNPRDGSTQSIKAINAGTPSETFTAPDSNDWVLHITKSASQIPLYDVYEIPLLATGSYANPYLQMPGDTTTPGFVTGTFTGPTRFYTIDGFWDGGDSWKLRVACDELGTWTYTTSSSDVGMNDKTGTYECVPSSNKGFIRVNPTHPHHFMWDDGTPYYWSGTALMVAHFDESQRMSQGGTDQVDTGEFQSFVQERSDQGFTATHWGYYGFNKAQFKDRVQANEGGAPFVNYDPDLLNPSYYQYGDQRVEAVLDAGIVPNLILGWPDQGIVNMGHDRMKRYWRYLIARYAAYNITYNLFGEANEFGGSWKTIVSDYVGITRTYDPYHHLLSTHTTGGPSPADIQSLNLDFAILQNSVSATSTYVSGLSMPIVNSEYGGYEGFQVTGDQLRPMTWNIRMRGGYFVYESWLSTADMPDPIHSPGAQYVKYNNDFFEKNTQYWLLEPNSSLFGGKQGLANPGNEYITYLQTGGTVTVDLSAASGTLDVSWYNPRTGVFTGQTTTTGGSSQQFTAPPDGNDWVLYIAKQASSTPAGDLNGDNTVNIQDIIILINEIFNPSGLQGSDITGDGKVDLLDVISLINIIFS